jgi:hypothetical protein
MGAAETPDQVGERLAEEAWAKEGRALILHPDRYAKVLADIAKKAGPAVRQGHPGRNHRRRNSFLNNNLRRDRAQTSVRILFFGDFNV